MHILKRIVPVFLCLASVTTVGHAAVVVDIPVECDGHYTGWTWRSSGPWHWFNSSGFDSDRDGCGEPFSGSGPILQPNEGTQGVHINGSVFSHADLSEGAATLEAGNYSLFFAISDFNTDFPSLEFEFAGITASPENCVACVTPAANTWELWELSFNVPPGDAHIGNVLSFRMDVGPANMAMDGVGDLSGLGSGLIVEYTPFSIEPVPSKKEKILICHVGNEEGPSGEVYDPGCEPDDDYDCSADAGKIDLILVSKKSKHVEEEAKEGGHSHVFDGLWDYYPADGVGADPADFEDGAVTGIDLGCELSEELSCPCWDTYTKAELVSNISSIFLKAPSCIHDPNVGWGWAMVMSSVLEGGYEILSSYYGSGPSCYSSFDPVTSYIDLTEEQVKLCVSEVGGVIDDLRTLGWCPPP